MKLSSLAVILWSFLSLIIFLIPLTLSAQESCGTITDDFGDARPIEDCGNPFNADTGVSFTWSASIDAAAITEGAEIYIEPGITSDLTVIVDSNAFTVSAELFRHSEGGYVSEVRMPFIGASETTSVIFDEPGTYSLLIRTRSDGGPSPVKAPSILDRVFAFLIPTAIAYYDDQDEVKQITFSVIHEEPAPEIDPLILEYEPILYLHPDENYRPMNVEAFINSSALWSTVGVSDTLIKEGGDTNPVTESDIAVPGESEDWYLAFSVPGEAKTFDPSAAKDKYDGLVADGEAVPTYYARKMEDSYTDANGETHEFIVLQYWYFYAFNDWLESGGNNNHEGDWESVFIFLDEGTKEPEYVAYSAHLNDGDPDLNIAQYDSVRRDWSSDEVVKEDDKPVSFVALGSHANYPNNAENGVHQVVAVEDLTSTEGLRMATSLWEELQVIKPSIPPWFTSYEGLWGTDVQDVFGENSGPRGPGWLSPALGGGAVRFHEPIEWAGIDNVTEVIVDEPASIFSFGEQLIQMQFTNSLEAGTELLIDLHDEIVSFGDNVRDFEFLPRFWDLETSLEDGSFAVDVTFNYSDEDIEQLEGDESNLSVLLYSDETKAWETVSASVNTEANTISFTTTHFSRYALGIPPQKSLGELFAELEDVVRTSELSFWEKRILMHHIDLAERFTEHSFEPLDRATARMLDNLERKIEQYDRRGRLESDRAEEMLRIIEEIREIRAEKEGNPGFDFPGFSRWWQN